MTASHCSHIQIKFDFQKFTILSFKQFEILISQSLEADISHHSSATNPAENYSVYLFIFLPVLVCSQVRLIQLSLWLRKYKS